MPNYLVELPESQTYSQLGDGATKMVIFAADEAGARRAAAGRFDGDGNALWNTEASVTELVVGLNLVDAGDPDGWQAFARITADPSGSVQTVDPIVASALGQTRDAAKGVLGKDRLHVAEAGIVINSGGTGYSIDDILTLSGGTAVRAATFRVITVSTGAITALELVDPGEYSVLPSLSTFVHTGASTDADLDAVQAVVGSHEALLAQLLTELDTFADLTPSLDLSEGASGARILTLATVGDGIGDSTIEVEIRHNGTPETVLVSTIVDGGSPAAVLTAAIPASPLAPPRVHVFGAFGN